MASFSSKFPVAVHVLPLTALKQVLKSRKLFAKSQIPAGQQRRTTRGVDAALGFTDVVHLYLSGSPENWLTLPVLAAQLGPARDPPFPHAALVLPTAPLTDAECSICLWNIAVSRPQVKGVCRGGNWTRGTAPAKIAERWQQYRATQPSMQKARGQWHGAALVPTLEGSQIPNNLPLLARAAGGYPELLLRTPFSLGEKFRLCAFSKEDAASIDRLGSEVPIEPHEWPGYDAGCPATTSWRNRIERYFANDDEPYPQDLDFDRVRRRSAEGQEPGDTLE